MCIKKQQKTTKNNKKLQKTTKNNKLCQLMSQKLLEKLFYFFVLKMKNTYFDSKQQGNHKKHLISQ